MRWIDSGWIFKIIKEWRRQNFVGMVEVEGKRKRWVTE